MDLKLHREVPVFRRCCFCLPLRRGLIGWGYARLIVDTLTIVYLILILTWLFKYVRTIYVSIYIAMVAFVFVDVAFTGLLIFACHKKNFKLLRISYIYSIAWLILYMICAAYGLISDITRIYSIWEYAPHRYLITDLVMTSALMFTTVFIQVYVILLTRSEAIKLQNQNLEMEFVNNAVEAEARCVSISTEQRCTDNGYAAVQYMDNGHENSVQYTDNGHDSSVQYGAY